MTKPVVAIIGRQNVGKSTLFNRMAGKPIAIVEDLPGTTRDRIFANISWQEKEFLLIDTGGLEHEPKTVISRGVMEQAETAIDDADVIIFMVDVRDGVTTDDQEISDKLRRVGKPVLLVANKADNPKYEAQAVEFHKLGMGEPMAISAYHDYGTTELLDSIISLLPTYAPAEAQSDIMKVAIIGRPGVGKSTLLNAMLGEKRAIIGEKPGTTRDAIDTMVDFDGRSVLLIDTAGIRRRGKLGVGVERYSVIRALDAIERADVVILILDALEPLTAQDMHIAGYVQQATKGIILVVNKWDMVKGKSTLEFTPYIKSKLKFMDYAPLLYVSAKLGRGVNRLMPQARKIYEERLKRVPTAEVNRTIQEAIAAHNLPPRVGTKHLKVLYATQAEVNPPTFIFFVNDSKLMHFSYQRFLENRLRRAFGFAGTSIRMVFKTRGESG